MFFLCCVGRFRDEKPNPTWILYGLMDEKCVDVISIYDGQRSLRSWWHLAFLILHLGLQTRPSQFAECGALVSCYTSKRNVLIRNMAAIDHPQVREVYTITQCITKISGKIKNSPT